MRGKMVGLLQKIIANILKSPDNEKFRSIKKGILQRKYGDKHLQIKNLMVCCGFIETLNGHRIQFLGNRFDPLKEGQALIQNKIDNPELFAPPKKQKQPDPEPAATVGDDAIAETAAATETSPPPGNAPGDAAMSDPEPSPAAAPDDVQMAPTDESAASTDPNEGLEQGEAFVTLSSRAEAEAATADLNGADFGGQNILVLHWPEDDEASSQLKVINLMSKITREHITKAFGNYGTIKVARVYRDVSKPAPKRRGGALGGGVADDEDMAAMNELSELQAKNNPMYKHKMKMSDLAGMTKEEKLAFMKEKREKFRSQKQVVARVKDTGSELSRRTNTKLALESKREREVQQLKSLADKRRREKEAVKRRKKAIKEKIRLQKEQRKREKKEEQDRKAKS